MKTFFRMVFSLRTFVLVLLGAVLIGGAVYLYFVQTAGASGPGFRTEAVVKKNLTATITATGTIEPEEVVDIGAQVTGQIMHFGVDPTDSTKFVDYCTPVKKGAILAEVDPKVYQAHVDQFQASLKIAQANLRQTQTHANSQKDTLLRDERSPAATAEAQLIIDQSNYDEAVAAVGVTEAAVEQAKANLKEALTNLDYCTIKAPVDGVIVDRRVNVGQTVVTNQNAASLFLLAKDLTHVQVWASVNEADIGNIHIGQDVTFTVDARPNESFRGTVQQIRYNATMTQNVVTFTVVVSAENKKMDAPGGPIQVKTPSGETVTASNSELELLPYLTANLTFHIAERQDALLVPNTALRWKPQLSQVAPDARDEYEQSLRKKAAKDAPDDPAAAPTTTTDKKLAKPRDGGAANHGMVWVQDGAYVRPIRMATGLTDGAMTEVVKVHEGDTLDVGMMLVTGESQGKGTSATTNPFAPPPIFAKPKKKEDQ